MKNKIFIKHWLELKPKNFSSKTDLYYLGVANKIHANLSPSSKFMLSQFLEKDEMLMFCCFLTCYFEDIISETNIWQTFKKLYKESHNKTLPFFVVDEDYVGEEINFEDVAFLTWYFLNCIQDEEFISPFNDFILDIAAQTMVVLEDEYEFAPENEKLKKFFSLKSPADDFYPIRAFVQKVFFDSYLFFADIKQGMEFEIFDTLHENEDDDPELLMSYVREITESYTFNSSSALLALKAKDWAAALIGKFHILHKTMNSISEKITGLFLYKGQNQKSVLLEHIASGMPFEMTKKSFDHYENLNEDDILYIGMVKYNEEWWFSGNFSVSEFDANTILDQKNSIEARAEVNFLNNPKERENILDNQKKAFLEFNNGSLLAFLEVKNVQSFVSKFFSYYNRSLNHTKQETEDAQKRAKEDGYFGSDNPFDKFDTEYGEMVVFFNPKNGIEFYTDIINAFPDRNNPFFTEESREDIVYLLMSQDCSTELVYHFLDTYKDQLDLFKNEPYKSYLKDIDFLLKFWKNDNYVTKQSMVLTGQNI